MKTTHKHLLLVAVSALALTSCKGGMRNLLDPTDATMIDTRQELTRQDYSNLMGTQHDPRLNFKKVEDEAAPIPELAPILAAPPAPKIGNSKLVSITVTDDVPLKDVLMELARLADVDMEVDAGISGGVTFRAKDKPFNEVIQRISDLAGLRYKMTGNVLRIERDTPYVEIYPVEFLNIERSGNSNINISTNVLSAGGGGSSSSGSSGGSSSGSSALNSGSSASVSATSGNDFWKQFEESLKQLLAYQPTARGTQTVAAAVPAGAVAAPGGGFYILNRQGSTLTLSASERQHALIKRFISQMARNATSQVLIEAKIVEVTLNQTFQSGIDWSRLGGSKILSTATFGSVEDSANMATFSFGSFNDVTGLNIDLDLAVRLAEQFGTTRTLQSPRLTAINNQQSVLTFAQNQVYFQITVDKETTATTSTTTELTVESEIKTVPIGIILTLQPSINLDTNEVTLNIRPTISRVISFVNDPAAAFLIAQADLDDLDVESRVPVVEVRELDTILKLKSGQVMVIGGLMEDRNSNTDTGLPYANDLPVIGNLFNGANRNSNLKELVIFIRATIIDSSGTSSNADRAVYKKFTTDPRPLFEQ